MRSDLGDHGHYDHRDARIVAQLWDDLQRIPFVFRIEQDIAKLRKGADRLKAQLEADRNERSTQARENASKDRVVLKRDESGNPQTTQKEVLADLAEQTDELGKIPALDLWWPFLDRLRELQCDPERGGDPDPKKHRVQGACRLLRCTREGAAHELQDLPEPDSGSAEKM